MRPVQAAASEARRRRPLWDVYPGCTPYRRLNPQLKVAAREYLRAGLVEARRQGLISGGRSRWDRQPWPLYGMCLNLSYTDISSGFVAALEADYPDRFADQLQFTYRDPKAYANAYLRAVIADSCVRGLRPTFNNIAARDMLRELDRILRLPEQEFASICVLSDVDFDAVDGDEVGGVTLSGRQDRIHFVSQMLPEALWADDHGYPMPGEDAQSLVFGRYMGKGDVWWVSGLLTQAMDRFVYALRLGTAATTHLRKLWSGETSMVHINVPSATEPEDSYVMDSHWRRRIALKPEHLPGLRRLMTVIESMEPDKTASKTKAGATAPSRHLEIQPVHANRTLAEHGPRLGHRARSLSGPRGARGDRPMPPHPGGPPAGL